MKRENFGGRAVVSHPSQKARRMGHPLFPLRVGGGKHFQERTAEPQVPPLRFAPVGMTILRGGSVARNDKWGAGLLLGFRYHPQVGQAVDEELNGQGDQ